MEETEIYKRHGVIALKNVLAEDMAGVLLAGIQQVVAQNKEKTLSAPRVAGKRSYELYGYNWQPLTMLLWGLTPLVERIIGTPIAPSYSYFRAYQEGDICYVHSDRDASEHSMSLTLKYADNIPWALAIGERQVETEERLDNGYQRDFGDEPYREFLMEQGDAVIYRGALYRHGRLKPNPNRWSAHLFLQWVERNGPFAKHAFDGRSPVKPGDFIFPQEPEPKGN
jgi:hypothetical protein